MAIEHGDIELNASNEIFGRDGDLAYNEVPEQHIGAIVNASKGNFRKHPTIGADVAKLQDGNTDSRETTAILQNELNKDGWKLLSVDLETNQDEISITVRDAIKTTNNTKSLI